MSQNSSVQQLTTHLIEKVREWKSTFVIELELSEQDVSALPAGELKNIWSAHEDFVSTAYVSDEGQISFQGGFPIIPGYHPGCNRYYLGRKPPGGLDSSGVFQEFRLECPTCEGDCFDAAGDECQECEGEGELIFDLDVMSATYSQY